MILSDEQAIDIIRVNQAVPAWLTKARTYSDDLRALISGENFVKVLIDKIDGVESASKAAARQKYCRDIKDFFDRLFLPIQNVFSATGGTKNYQVSDYKLSEKASKKLLSVISDIRDGKSIERYIESTWMNLYHTDPAGVLWMRYTTADGVVNEVYPTYQSSGALRNYLPKGQLTEWFLLEPATIDNVKIWVIVDDLKQRTVMQTGDNYSISDDPLKTFAHPFGKTPVVIISNIIDKSGKRLSPIDNIIQLAKEYARDQSIKTLYKLNQGFPKHWRRAMFCKTCNGVGKNGTADCTACGGKGEVGGVRDVVDQAVLPMPEQGEPVLKGEDIMGFSSPDLETWKQFNDELELLENAAYKTMWGVIQQKQIAKTATEIYFDMQPQINKLNKYADAAEWLEWQVTELCANAIDPLKDKKKQISLIVYGRRYILEGIDTLQKKYEDARTAGENTVILDSIFDELLTVKFKNDPEWLSIELKKARLEPYLHQSLTEINTIFGAREAGRKVYFQRWWKGLSDGDFKAEIPVLQSKFDTDFTAHWTALNITNPSNSPTI